MGRALDLPHKTLPCQRREGEAVREKGCVSRHSTTPFSFPSVKNCAASTPQEAFLFQTLLSCLSPPVHPPPPLPLSSPGPPPLPPTPSPPVSSFPLPLHVPGTQERGWLDLNLAMLLPSSVALSCQKMPQFLIIMRIKSKRKRSRRRKKEKGGRKGRRKGGREERKRGKKLLHVMWYLGFYPETGKKKKNQHWWKNWRNPNKVCSLADNNTLGVNFLVVPNVSWLWMMRNWIRGEETLYSLCKFP